MDKQRQDISDLLQTKFIIVSDVCKAFVLDVKKIKLNFLQSHELIFVINQASKLDLKIVGFGELLIDLTLKIELVGVDAVACVTGAFLLTKKSSMNLNVLQKHMTPNAQSDVNIKTALLDNSQFNYQGTIFIAEHASGTIAHQENKNIVLSKDVNIKSVPNIEALNNDVQCGHGSAVGGLDSELLVYLMCRGLSMRAATNLLLKSFLKIDLGLDYA